MSNRDRPIRVEPSDHGPLAARARCELTRHENEPKSMVRETIVRRGGWRLAIRTVLAVGLLVACASPGFAITDEDIYNQLRFNFVNPGGRALAMGGAAIAAVQDSTASLSNPGALVALTDDEFFVEYRATTFDTLENASFEVGSVTAVNGSSVADVGSMTYVSYVRPWYTTRKDGSFRQWSLAFSRQEVANTNRTVDGQEVRVDDDAGQGRFLTNTADGNVDLEIIQYNIGFAGQITRNWSIGLTGSFAQMDLTSNGASVTRDPFNIGPDASNPRFRLDDETTQFSTQINGETADDFTYSFGIYWQPNSFYGDSRPPFRLGLTYSAGPQFDVPITVFGADGQQIVDPLDVNSDRKFVLDVPDRYGLGFAYEWLTGPNEENRLTLATDAIWVGYTNLLNGFENGLNPFTSTGVAIDYTIDDGYELRAGFEWSRQISRSWNFDVRFGYARLPANVIYADRVEPIGDANLEEGLGFLYREGSETDAASVGFSFAFIGRGVNSLLDVAYQTSDEFDQGVVSYILRF